MLKDGFLRFCDDPEIACCRGEAELGQLRQENIRLRAELLESQRRERAAVADMTEMANLSEDAELCEFCKWYGDDDCQHPTGGPHCFDWRGPQEAGS